MMIVFPGAIAGATGVMEALQQRHELIEVLQPADILRPNLARRSRLPLHAAIMHLLASTRNTEQMYCPRRKSRAEHDWLRPVFALH